MFLLRRFMRTFRLLTLCKVLRLFEALRFSREPRLTPTAVVESLASLFWALTMLGFTFFIFGLNSTQGVTSCTPEAEHCLAFLF